MANQADVRWPKELLFSLNERWTEGLPHFRGVEMLSLKCGYQHRHNYDTESDEPLDLASLSRFEDLKFFYLSSVVPPKGIETMNGIQFNCETGLWNDENRYDRIQVPAYKFSLAPFNPMVASSGWSKTSDGAR